MKIENLMSARGGSALGGKNEKWKLKIILLVIGFLVLSAEKSEAAFSCNTGTVNDTCVISTAHNLESGDTAITGSGTINITSTGSIVGLLGQATTITIGNLNIASGGYINFDGKGLAGGAGGIGINGTAGNTAGAGGGAGGVAEVFSSNGGGGGGYCLVLVLLNHLI